MNHYAETWGWDGVIASLANFGERGYSSDARNALLNTQTNMVFAELARRKHLNEVDGQIQNLSKPKS